MQFAGELIDRVHLRGLDDNSLYRLHDRVKAAVAAAPGGTTRIDLDRATLTALIVKELDRRKLQR